MVRRKTYFLWHGVVAGDHLYEACGLQEIALHVGLVGTEDADGKTRAGEGMAFYEFVGQTQHPADAANLILVEVGQRLDHTTLKRYGKQNMGKTKLLLLLCFGGMQLNHQLYRLLMWVIRWLNGTELCQGKIWDKSLGCKRDLANENQWHFTQWNGLNRHVVPGIRSVKYLLGDLQARGPSPTAGVVWQLGLKLWTPARSIRHKFCQEGQKLKGAAAHLTAEFSDQFGCIVVSFDNVCFCWDGRRRWLNEVRPECTWIREWGVNTAIHRTRNTIQNTHNPKKNKKTAVVLKDYSAMYYARKSQTYWV